MLPVTFVSYFPRWIVQFAKSLHLVEVPTTLISRSIIKHVCSLPMPQLAFPVSFIPFCKLNTLRRFRIAQLAGPFKLTLILRFSKEARSRWYLRLEIIHFIDFIRTPRKRYDTIEGCWPISHYRRLDIHILGICGVDWLCGFDFNALSLYSAINDELHATTKTENIFYVSFIATAMRGHTILAGAGVGQAVKNAESSSQLWWLSLQVGSLMIRSSHKYRMKFMPTANTFLLLTDCSPVSQRCLTVFMYRRRIWIHQCHALLSAESWLPVKMRKRFICVFLGCWEPTRVDRNSR